MKSIYKKSFLIFFTLSILILPMIGKTQNLSTPEKAVENFILAFNQGNTEEVAKHIHPDCTKKEEVDFREKKVPREIMIQSSKMLFGKEHKITATQEQSKPGREGWIKVKFEITKEDGEKSSRRIYVKKDGENYKVINL